MALATADEVGRHRHLPGAARRRSRACHGLLVVDAVSELRPGMPLAWQPTLEQAAAYLSGRLREGDLVLTVGAGDVRRVGDLLLS